MTSKIVYLFGAGSTHAEKLLQCKALKIGFNEKGEIKDGLLARHVSKRVFERFLKEKSKIAQYYGITKYSIDEPWGSNVLEHGDVELFISLVESLRTEKTQEHAKILRRYFQEDICKNIIVGEKEIIPRLHSSLIELHREIKHEESLTGFLTLNYDSIFEKSFKLTRTNVDYGIDVDNNKPPDPSAVLDKKYLLKLHGSFDWYLDSKINKISLKPSNRLQDILWVPPGLNKEYLNYPYNLIHGKAFELLCQCDILRIVGCSLNQNNMGLISLIFRTQKHRRNPYSIEIISSPAALQELKERLGMIFSFSESFYENDKWQQFGKSPDNSFLDWLYYNVAGLSSDKLHKTHYLKDIKLWM